MASSWLIKDYLVANWPIIKQLVISSYSQGLHIHDVIVAYFSLGISEHHMYQT